MSDEYKPWEEYPHIWKTKSSYMGWIRGGIRRHLWQHHPLKREVMADNMVMMKNTNTRSMKRFPMVKTYKCEICEGMFRSTQVECDHIDGHHKLTELGDIQTFINNIVLIKKEHLRVLCKPCHVISSIADARNISFDEAVVEKEVIEFGKLKASKQVDKLKKMGYTPESNAKKRIEQIRQHLNK